MYGAGGVTETHVVTEADTVVHTSVIHILLGVASLPTDHTPVPLDSFSTEVALPGDGPVLVPVGDGVLDTHPSGSGAGRSTASLSAGSHDLGYVGRVHPVLVIVSPHQGRETGDFLSIFLKLKSIVFL